MNRLVKSWLMLGILSALPATSITAQTTNIFDEFGHGLIQTNNGGSLPLQYRVAPDPSLGLLGSNVLIYTLSFIGVDGDVLIFNPFSPGTPLDDVIRFANGTNLIFYADSIDGYTDLADTLGPPNPLLVNQASIFLSGDGHVAYYTAGIGQPGYNAANPNYVFLIDVPVPEPSAAFLSLCGLGVFGLMRLRKNLRTRKPGLEQ